MRTSMTNWEELIQLLLVMIGGIHIMKWGIKNEMKIASLLANNTKTTAMVHLQKTHDTWHTHAWYITLNL